MIRKYLPFYFLMLVVGLCFTACNSDDEATPEENEEEVITTLTYTLASSSGDVAIMSFVDLDGDGGNAPVVTGGTLTANTTYTGDIVLLNQAETPAEDVTAEIREEDADHQFFFSTTIAGLSVAYGDQDGDGNPVGLATTVTTCLLYTSPSPRDKRQSRMPSSA